MTVTKAKRMRLIIIVAVAVAIAAVASAIYLSNATKGTSLPAGCVRPANGFLVIASSRGYNDSVGHGVGPNDSWPVLNVQMGQSVNVVVCNTDIEAHGFQIYHYFDSHTVSIAPRQVIRVSFVANQAGTFRIYCSIFCVIHVPYMQYGELVVTP